MHQTQNAFECIVDAMRRSRNQDVLLALAAAMAAIPGKVDSALIVDQLKRPDTFGILERSLVTALEESSAPHKLGGNRWRAAEWVERSGGGRSHKPARVVPEKKEPRSGQSMIRSRASSEIESVRGHGRDGPVNHQASAKRDTESSAQFGVGTDREWVARSSANPLCVPNRGPTKPQKQPENAQRTTKRRKAFALGVSR